MSCSVFNVHGSVHLKNILIYVQQDATLHSLFYLKTAIHVSGGNTTHHQERKQLYVQHLVFVTPLLLPPEGRRPLGRPRRRCDDNIKMDLQKLSCEGMDWIQLAQYMDRWRALVNVVMNFRVPWNAVNFLIGWKTVSFSSWTLLHRVSK